MDSIHIRKNIIMNEHKNGQGPRSKDFMSGRLRANGATGFKKKYIWNEVIKTVPYFFHLYAVSST